MRLAAVLWDMDGLLVDTEPIWTVAEVELAATLGGTWTDDIKAAVVGTRLDVSVPTILRWYEVEATPARVTETAAWLLHRVAELYSDALPARADLGRDLVVVVQFIGGASQGQYVEKTRGMDPARCLAAGIAGGSKAILRSSTGTDPDRDPEKGRPSGP